MLCTQLHIVHHPARPLPAPRFIPLTHDGHYYIFASSPLLGPIYMTPKSITYDPAFHMIKNLFIRTSLPPPPINVG